VPRPISLALVFSFLFLPWTGAAGRAARAQEAAAPSPLPRVVRSLDECVAIALERHPGIGAADADVEAGRARIGQARSGYLPQLSGDWSTNRQKSSFSSRTGGPSNAAGGAVSQANAFTFHQGAVSLSQTLFDFGQTFAAIRAAQARTDSLAADADTTRRQIVLEVKESYFGLLAARRLADVAEETVRSNEQQLAQARGRNEVGFAPRLDVTRSEVQLASAELDRLSARNNVSIAEVTLQNALGVDGPLAFELEDVLADPRPVPEERSALERAYERRPELLSLLAEERAAEQDVAQRWRQLLPTVRGNANYGGSASDFPLEEQWSVGAAVDVPIFDGGLTLSRVSEGKAVLHSLRFEQQRLRQQIALQVRTALLDVQRTAEAMRVTERATGQARENLELAEGRYQTGVGNVIELVDAQRARASADADYVRALYDHQIAVAALEQAIGEELPRP
jgi:TolC family type I secretion outer membrane protein